MRLSENVGAMLAGGALAGIGSSVCCLGPLLLLSLGSDSAWIDSSLAFVEALRPVFIALAFVLAGLAFRQLYLATPSRHPWGESRVMDRARKAQRIAFWIMLPSMIGLIAARWWIPLLNR